MREFPTTAVAVLAASSLLAASCATFPVTGVPATGQPLGIHYESSTHGYMTTEKVGEVQYRGAAGENLGTAGIYQDKAVVYHRLDWVPIQGNTVISDEDFFRIAGDREAAAEVHAHDRTGKIVNRVGWAIALAGLGLIGASFAVHNRRFADEGMGVVAVGGITAYVGKGYFDADQHAVPLGHAKAVAEAYNARLPPRPSTIPTSSTPPPPRPAASAPASQP
jgi:hypothetical protein